MHELALTQSIVEACIERAAGARVLRVTLAVGTLACVMPEALRFCYDLAVTDTVLEGSELEIIRIHARARCQECGREVKMDDILALCACGSANLQRPSGGDGLQIRSMELEAPAAEAS
ncbi:MAG TPA: hydrogenase maturation nickel metallochaperone HypA [Steroidobacteraceae bacterium]|jgi:hydrogenase nickel incorporation protein HypA/HybF